MTGMHRLRLAVVGLIAGFGVAAGVAWAQPTNGTFATAMWLSGGFGSVTNDNTLLTAQAGAPPIAGFKAVAPLWYKWLAPANGEVTMDTLGTADPTGSSYLDTTLGVFTGASLSNLTQIAANDDQYPIVMQKYPYNDPNGLPGNADSPAILPLNGPSLVRFTAVSNTVYYVAVDSKAGYQGNLVLNWAYHPAGVFRFATEQFDETTFAPLFLCSEMESQPDDTTTYATYYNYFVPGVLVSVTRLGGAAGRVLVDYTTADGAGFGGAVAGTDYTNVSGTLVFDDNEMIKSFVVPINSAQVGVNANSRDFQVILSNPRLDPAETSIVEPPRLDPVMANGLVRILSLTGVGSDPNQGPTGNPLVGPTHDIFNFPRVHFRVPRDVNNYYTTVKVDVIWQHNWFPMPGNTNAPGDSATINYQINNVLESGSDTQEEANNQFGLEPESDYAIPSPSFQKGLQAPTNSDYILAAGSINVSYNSGPVPITFTIPNNQITEFNKDFHIYIWRNNNGPVTEGQVNEAIVTVLFDDDYPPAGSVDEVYNPDHNYEMATSPRPYSDPFDIGNPGADGQVMSLLVLTNSEVLLTNSVDQMLIAGDFSTYNTYHRNRIARVNNNGSLDYSFDPGDGPNGFVSSIALAPTGGYLIGGAFSAYQSSQRNGVALIDARGNLNPSFNPGFGANGPVRAVLALANGKYLIAGDFTSYNGTNSSHIAQLNADGSLDGAFAANVPVFNGQSIYALAVNSAGRIYVGGSFSTVGGNNMANLACLNSNGTLYGQFGNSIGVGLNGSVYSVVIDNAGQVLVGGAFTLIGATPLTRIARLNPNGSVDGTFNPGTGPDDTVYSIVPQADGTLYLGGMFLSYNGTRRLGFARLYNDGTVDTTFMDSAFNQFAGLHRLRFGDPVGVVLTTGIQGDGNVLIGGSFSQVGGGQADPLVRIDASNTIVDTNGVSIELSYTNNVWVEPKTRDGLRNRQNVARLIGGATPGPGNLGLTYASYNVAKSQTALTVSLSRTNGTLGYATANFMVPSGVAQSGVDYNYFGDLPTFQTDWMAPFLSSTVNSTSRQYEDGMFGAITVPNNAWGIDYYQYLPGRVLVSVVKNGLSGDRQAQFQLANPVNADQFFLGGANIPIGEALGRSAAPFTITDDSHKLGTIGFAQAIYTVNEGAGVATVNVSRTNGSYGTVAVHYTTTSATSTNAVIGQDYWATNGTLTFLAGVTNMTFAVPIIDNTLIQPADRIVGLALSSPTLGVIGSSNASLYIIDNDNPLGYVKFDSTGYTNVKSAGSVVATVTRVGSSRGVISVLCSSTNNSTAQPGVDYVSITTNLTWNDGDSSSRYVVLPLLNNGNVGPNTALELLLSNPIGYNTNAPLILGGSHTTANVGILDDNLYGTLAFSATNYTVNENGGYVTITVVRSGGASQTLTVNFTTADGQNTYYQGEGTTPNYVMTAGTLVFQPNQVAASFNVPILDDGTVDPTPFYFIVSLSGLTPAGAALGSPATATVSIIDAEAVNQPPGTADPNFAPVVPGFNGNVLSLQVQTNGQVVVAGGFTMADGISRNYIARVDTDCGLDDNFLAGLSGANAPINTVLLQSDGNIVVGGAFTNINNLTRNHVARLLPDGTSDTTFSPGGGADGPVYSLAETFANGGAARQLLVGGSFTYFNGIPHTSLLRLNNDGGLDATFTPALDSGSTVYGITVYPATTLNSGKILIVGDFATVNGYPRAGVARLNADGTLDTSFDPGFGATNAVRAVVLQLDGRIVLGGSFTYFNNVAYNHLVRLNADGTLDTTFNVGVGTDDTVNALALQTDNRLVVAGAFTHANGVSRSRLTRLLPDGTVDPSINFGLGANNYISALAIQPDGKFVIGGGFTQYDGQSRSHLARIFGGSMAGAGALTFLTPTFAVDENGTNALITVRRTGGTAGSVAIDFATANGTGTNPAIAGVNFSNVTATITFPNGETFETVSVPVMQDFKITPDLEASLTLSNPRNGAVLGDQYLGTLLIYNDDSAVSFSSATYAYQQNIASGSASIQLVRQGSSRLVSLVDFYTTTNGTAIAGTEYLSVSNTFVFAVGQSNATAFVPLINYPGMLNDTTVDMRLTNVVNTLAFNPVEATLTILSTNAAPGQFMFPQTNFVFNGTVGVAAITVQRTNGHTGPVSVNFATVSPTNGAIAGLNYVATNGTLSFADGELTKTIYVTLLDPHQAGASTVFDVVLSGPSGGTSILGGNLATVNLLNVYQGVGFPSLGGNPAVYSVPETAGSVVLSVSRLLTNDTTTVQYATADGTAVAGVNYVTNSGTLTFIPGEATKSLSISILHDPRVTGALSFTVNLFNPSAPATLYPNATATVNIQDVDAGIAFSTNFFGVLKSGTNVVISVTRSNANTGVVSVNFATTNGTAVAGQDYYQTNGTLIFSNGIALQSFSIPIINNHVMQGDRSFQVLLFTNALTLGSPQLLPPSMATVTITDNVSGLSFSSPAYQVNENGNHAVITVLRSGYTNSSVTVDFSTVSGTNSDSAVAGVNYYPTNGTLLFTNGQTVQTFAVPVIDNNRVDGDHLLQLNLANPLVTNSLVGFAVLTTPSAANLTISEADGSEILSAGTVLTFTRSFTNSTPLSLATANGAHSSILVTNLPTQVEKVVLHVPSVTTPAAQDLALMLTAPSGTNAGLAANAGSAALSHAGLVFDDGAAVSLPQNAPITNGTYRPTVFGSLPGFGLTPAPTYSTNLSTFADSLPNGSWTLYAADDTAPYSGALEIGWSMDLTCLETNASRLIQPGETVTMLFAFRDAAGFGVTNLVATLLATNGVANPSTPQSYGPLLPNGPSASRLFTFTANGTNGQVIAAQFQLQDGTRTLNNVVFNFLLGAGAVIFSNTAPIYINDDTVATPYPSQITVSGVGSLVTKATATLTNLAHTYPSDIDILLMSPTGQKSYLMAKTGGSQSITNVTLTFDDAAANLLPASLLTSGSYKPTSYAAATPIFPPTSTPAGPYVTNMTTFAGNNPNGTWSLYVIDDTRPNSGIISNGWFLTLTTASPIPSAADIGVAVVPSATSVIVTSNVTFNVTLINYGPGVATNVQVAITLPTGATYSPGAGSFTTNAAGQLVWNVGMVLKGAQVVLPITVWPAVTGQAVVSVMASTTSTDLNPSDDQASAAVTVIAPTADLVLGLASLPNLVPLNNNYELLATITNLGPATATGVTLSLLLDPSVTLVSTVPATGSLVNGILTFTNLGNLGSNSVLSVAVVVHPTLVGINNTYASCASGVTDPAKANNDNSAKTQVVGALQLQVQSVGINLLLSWPASLGLYNLQSATNLAPPVTWVTLTNVPALVGGNYTYTNPVGSGASFFRLIGPTR